MRSPGRVRGRRREAPHPEVRRPGPARAPRQNCPRPGWARLEASMRKSLVLSGSGALACERAGRSCACGDDTVRLRSRTAAPERRRLAGAAVRRTRGRSTARRLVDRPRPPGRRWRRGGAAARRACSSRTTASTQSELAAFGMQSQAVDGRLLYPRLPRHGVRRRRAARGCSSRRTTSWPGSTRCSPGWSTSSWNVALERRAGRRASRRPTPIREAVVVGAGTKAYVLRYTRNLVAVIDTSADVDGGAPTATDRPVAAQVQAGGDGYVEMSAGFYEPRRAARVRAAREHQPLRRGAATATCLLCAGTRPTIVAIDTTTDKLVDLGGAAPGHGVARSSGFAHPRSARSPDASTTRRTAGCSCSRPAATRSDARRRRGPARAARGRGRVALATGRRRSCSTSRSAQFPGGRRTSTSTSATSSFSSTRRTCGTRRRTHAGRRHPQRARRVRARRRRATSSASQSNYAADGGFGGLERRLGRPPATARVTDARAATRSR